MLQRVLKALFAGKSAMWTAIFTGVLTLFTVKMYQVSNATSQIARNSERAFVSFDGFTLGPRIMGQDRVWNAYEININWNNGATTPARDVVFQSNGISWPGTLPTGYDFPLSKDKPIGVVGPKGSYSQIVAIARQSLTDSWSGKGHLYVWGDVVYRDIFPEDGDRLTEFCQEINHITVGPPQADLSPNQTMTKTQATTQPGVTLLAQPVPIDNPNSTIIAFHWSPCAEHNCYDEDCRDYSGRVEAMRAP